MKVQKLNCIQAYYLSIFDFTLKHVLGTKIEKVNRISKRLDWKIGMENGNNNQKLIEEE